MTRNGSEATRNLTPVQKLAFTLMLVFLFLLHCRIFDVKLTYLRIPILTFYACIILVIVTGGVFRAFSHRIGMWLLIFSFWLLLCAGTGVWIRGSLEMLEEYWMIAMLVYCVIAALVFSYGQFRVTMHVMAYAIIGLALVALIWGSSRTGRLFIPRSRFANPNDLAQMLLMGFPFCWFLATNARNSWLARAVAVLGMAPIFVAMAKTGSRGAMIGLGAMVLLVFLRFSISDKIKVGVVVGVAVVCAVAALPASLRQRYVTFFDKSEPQTLRAGKLKFEDSATSSAHARWYLFQRSLLLTFYHPVFGVGPGMFAVGDDVYAREEGRGRGTWAVTHNTYTQVSSEAGLPGLVLYLVVLGVCWKAAGAGIRLKGKRRRKRLGEETDELDEAAGASFCLKLSLFSYAVSAMFSSVAYNAHLATLAALAMVFERTTRQLASRVAEQLPAPRRPVWLFGGRLPAFIQEAARRRMIARGASFARQ